MADPLSYAESIHLVALDDQSELSDAYMRRFMDVADHKLLHPACKRFLVELARGRGVQVNEELGARVLRTARDDRIVKRAPEKEPILYAETVPEFWATYLDALKRAEAFWRYESVQPSDEPPSVVGSLTADLVTAWEALEAARALHGGDDE